MRKVEAKEYQTFEAYKEFQEVFRGFGQMVLVVDHTAYAG